MAPFSQVLVTGELNVSGTQCTSKYKATVHMINPDAGTQFQKENLQFDQVSKFLSHFVA